MLYRQTSAKLFGVCLRVLNDRAEAEEALQEVFVKIWTKADRFAVSDLSPISWLVAIARNHAIDRIRARRQATADIDVALDIADPSPGPEAMAVAGDENERIYNCLDELEQDRAAAVRGAYLKGESYARACGTPRRSAEHDAYLAAPQPDETQGMSREMTSVDNNEPERGSDDIVAAEYVLGVLPAPERTAAARRIDVEAAFARLVEQWEGYFAPLAVAYQAVEPPASVKVALDRRLFAIGGAAPSTPAQPSLWSSLALWRGLAAAAIAAFAIYIAVPYFNPPAAVPQTRLVASLAPNASDVQLSCRLRRRDWRGGVVSRLRRARRRPRLRAVDGRGPERARFDGRHPGRRHRATCSEA